MAKIAFILDEMFEDSEFRFPYDRLKEAGHEVVIVGKEASKQLKGKKGHEVVTTDTSIEDVSADEFDALMIPGGYSPDKLRMDKNMVAFTRAFDMADKPVAAICHAGWMLVEADIADERTVTSWPSIKTDLINAGARWVNREVVEDRNLITSRKPEDLEAFTDAILRLLEKRKGTHSAAQRQERRPFGNRARRYRRPEEGGSSVVLHSKKRMGLRSSSTTKSTSRRSMSRK